ncbi:MAG: hypothetical protein IJQ34_00010 [Kiritimatiellae bacterium]|nr:hypothetical protein [Kiritimatiellia bacterium]
MLTIPKYHGARLSINAFKEYIDTVLAFIKGKEELLMITKEAVELNEAYSSLKKFTTMPRSHEETKPIQTLYKVRKNFLLSFIENMRGFLKMPLNTQFRLHAENLKAFGLYRPRIVRKTRTEIDGFVRRLTQLEKYLNEEETKRFRASINGIGLNVLVSELKKAQDEMDALERARTFESARRKIVKKNLKIQGKIPLHGVDTSKLKKECSRILMEIISRINFVQSRYPSPEVQKVVEAFLGHIYKFKSIDKIARSHATLSDGMGE